MHCLAILLCNFYTDAQGSGLLSPACAPNAGGEEAVFGTSDRSVM